MSKFNPKTNIKRAINVSRRTKKVLEDRLSPARHFIFSVDSPRKKLLDTREVSVEGWIIPKQGEKYELRVRNNGVIHAVETGKKRLDVAKAHPHIPKDAALYSGFEAQFDFEDGELIVEIDYGKGFKKLYDTPISFGVESLPAAIYNKELSNNYPEHVNLLENRQKIYYEEASTVEYARHEKDARAVAMYLPQFHPFAENNKAWGEGFTEWTNVTTGQARFVGHQQPVLPKDLGFYDLRLESNIEAQIKLAKKYGVYGFCFYYYWFSGKKLMEKPLESVLAHKEWDFNFTICWANENWTKRWDGRDNEVIIAQEYRENDPLDFIKDVEHVLLDKRYITEDDKPVLMVYRASELKEPKKYAEVWREYFRTKHKKELQLVSFMSFDDKDPRDYGFDAALDFAPLSAFFKNHLFEGKQFPFIDVRNKLLDVNFSGVVADYRSIAVNQKLENAYNFPVYPCVTPSWDNEARKKGKGFTYQNSSPDLYASWLKRVVTSQAAAKDQPLVFINAWNEWAEGAVLEPSMHLGHATLKRTAEVLASQSHNKQNAVNFPEYGLPKAKAKLAVVVHLYYTDLWPSLKKRLESINEPFDLFVTINERDKDFKPAIGNKRATTFVLPNRGRDVLPFLYVARRLQAAGYEYVLKLHSKKSKHRQDGSDWLSDVLQNLLPDSATVDAVISTLQKTDTGLIGPAGHLVSLKRHMGSNQAILENLLARAYDKPTAAKTLARAEYFPYFGGTMFWARLDALNALLSLHLMPDDFQSEHGQVDGTTAHAVERFFGASAGIEAKRLYEVSGNGVRPVTARAHTAKYQHAP